MDDGASRLHPGTREMPKQYGTKLAGRKRSPPRRCGYRGGRGLGPERFPGNGSRREERRAGGPISAATHIAVFFGAPKLSRLLSEGARSARCPHRPAGSTRSWGGTDADRENGRRNRCLRQPHLELSSLAFSVFSPASVAARCPLLEAAPVHVEPWARTGRGPGRGRGAVTSSKA